VKKVAFMIVEFEKRNVRNPFITRLIGGEVR